MVLAVTIGAGFGLGLWALLVFILPPRPGLRELLDTMESQPPARPSADTRSGWVEVAGAPFVGLLSGCGLPGPRMDRDLALLGCSREAHLADKAVFALLGLVLPSVLSVALVMLGMGLGWTVSTITSLLTAVAGFLLPDVATRRDATRRRADFRLALGAYLNLVRVTLAGGSGVEGALSDAVSIGQGWAFGRLRAAVTTAKITRTTPWSTLHALGTELGVGELNELAGSVSLAGTEGAHVRASLQAKSAALRTRELTDAETDAQSATERMSLPLIVLFAGFLVFIGYPAITAVLGGFHHM